MQSENSHSWYLSYRTCLHPHLTLAPARLPVPEGSRVLLSLPQRPNCWLFLFPYPRNFLCRFYLKRKPRSLAQTSLRGSAPPHPAPGPARPLSRRAGEVPLLAIFLSLCPAASALRACWGALTRASALFTPSEAPDSLSLESVPGGSSAAGSTCSRRGLSLPPTPRESPCPAERPTFPRRRAGDAPGPFLAPPAGVWRRSRAPRRTRTGRGPAGGPLQRRGR